jgi:hypothetical protein
MIKQGDVIKHQAFMDVAIQIITSNTHPKTGDIEVRGIYLNQGQVETFSINEPAHFIIKKRNLKNWYKCLKPESKFIRNESWEQLQ